ncbi:MAG: RNA-binding domain-containing protein [Haloarculaceae archaeon]
MIYSVDVEITAPVYDTEVTDRVRDAIWNLFPNAELTETPGELRGETHSLETFSEHLHRQEILDAARTVFFDDQRGDAFSFDLKKQAAFEDVVSFAVGNPSELGDIHVRVRVEEPDVETYVDHVAPPTEEGVPITPEDADGR